MTSRLGKIANLFYSVMASTFRKYTDYTQQYGMPSSYHYESLHPPHAFQSPDPSVWHQVCLKILKNTYFISSSGSGTVINYYGSGSTSQKVTVVTVPTVPVPVPVPQTLGATVHKRGRKYRHD